MNTKPKDTCSHIQFFPLNATIQEIENDNIKKYSCSLVHIFDVAFSAIDLKKEVD